MSKSNDDTIQTKRPKSEPPASDTPAEGTPAEGTQTEREDDKEPGKELAGGIVDGVAGIATGLVDNPIVDVAINTGAEVTKGLTEAGMDLKKAIQDGEFDDMGSAIGAAGGAIGPLGLIPGKNTAKAVGITQKVIAAGAGATAFVGKAKNVRAERKARREAREIKKDSPNDNDALQDVKDAILGKEDQGNVVCKFECGQESWLVSSVNLVDKLDESIEGDIEIQSETIAADPRSILGKPCLLSFDRVGDVTAYPLVVTSVEHAGQGDSWSKCRIRVNDPLHLARLGRNSRIFQNETVRAILSTVLEFNLEHFNIALEMPFEDDDHPTYEYKTQYDESDYGFVHRLLSENGLSYWYEFKDGTHTLVIQDNPLADKKFQDVESPEGRTIGLSPYRASDGGRETIVSFSRGTRTRNNKVTVSSYDWTRPMVAFKHEVDNEHADEETKGAVGGGVREHFIQGKLPLNFFSYDEDQRANTKDDLMRQAKIRSEQLGRLTSVADGQGTVTGFRAGRVFDLVGPTDSNGEYLLVEVSHSFERNERSSAYSNHFVCVPTSIPYRPPAQETKPRVYGVETATVIGPSDQEIHTDVHGRVQVKFHWDRRDEQEQSQEGEEKALNASCFIRAMQAWAGNGWGFSFVPRIGMEVVVGFIHGDPDRPIITGSLYNGENAAAYTSQKEYTKSTLRTRSTEGGEEERWKKSVVDVGYNELTFEDKAGEEQVFIRAQKDMLSEVLNNQTINIGTEAEEEGGNQSVKITGHQDETVDKNKMLTVKGSQNIVIDGAEAAGGVTGASLTITGAYVADVSETVHIKAPEKITITCGGADSMIEMVPGKITLKAGEGAMLVLDANAQIQSNDGSVMLLDKEINGKSVGKSTLHLSDNLKLTTPNDAMVEGKKNATVVGEKSKFVATSSGVKVTGTKVDVNG